MYNNLKIQNTRILNNILGFWGSIFSNFHIHSFKYENIWFPSSEHAFMWKKADYFQDNEAKDLILSTKLPRKLKTMVLKSRTLMRKNGLKLVINLWLKSLWKNSAKVNH